MEEYEERAARLHQTSCEPVTAYRDGDRRKRPGLGTHTAHRGFHEIGLRTTYTAGSLTTTLWTPIQCRHVVQAMLGNVLASDLT